jgi:hypothetical protein
MSTRSSMIIPNRIAPMPSNVALFSPGPVPVNARDPDGAVTIRLAGEAVPLEPDALGGSVPEVTAGAAVDVVVADVVADVVAVVGPVVVLVDDVVACDVDVVDPGVVVVDAGGSVVVEAGGSVVVVTGSVLVVVAPVVVVDDPPPATAITGAMAAAVGVVVVMPEGVTESLGYAVQVSDRALPATVRDRLAAESSWMVTSELVAVNPLTVAAVEGSVSGTPSVGMGLGKGRLKLSCPWGVVAGVAPLASIWVVAEPDNVGETAAAAVARLAGRLTMVW